MFPKEKEIKNMLAILKMLQDETRLKIVFALMDSKKCVNEIVNLVGKTQSAISHQLKDMKKNNLVSCEKQGNKVFYNIADNHVKKVVKLCLLHAQEF